mmetsp:Transcript_4035/g.3816  ORF Transcript_4035/g.3816 Transcript_4035/m.3816 type:complete len:106 (+) Transcript_4035:9-326(+)
MSEKTIKLPLLNLRKKKGLFLKGLSSVKTANSSHAPNSQCRNLSGMRSITANVSNRSQKEKTPLFGRKGPKLDRKFEKLLKLNHRSALRNLECKLRTYDEFTVSG